MRMQLRPRPTAMAIGLLAISSMATRLPAQSAAVGVFTQSGDVGSPAIKGSTTFDEAKQEYRIVGAGANMWAKQDQFQYAWKEIAGNFTVTATMQFLGQGNAAPEGRYRRSSVSGCRRDLRGCGGAR